jgi:hypothetical protein
LVLALVKEEGRSPTRFGHLAVKEVDMNTRHRNNIATLEKKNKAEKRHPEAGIYSGLKFGFTESPSALLKAWIAAEVATRAVPA